MTVDWTLLLIGAAFPFGVVFVLLLGPWEPIVRLWPQRFDSWVVRLIVGWLVGVGIAQIVAAFPQRPDARARAS